MRNLQFKWTNKNLIIFIEHWLLTKKAFFTQRTEFTRTSLYPKDKVFVKIYNEIDNSSSKKTNIINAKLLLNTSFIEKREDVDRSTLYSFSGPFEALQADIADIRLLGKLAADPKYRLLFVDLFTSMIYTYPMKKHSLLPKKMLIIEWAKSVCKLTVNF